MKLHLPEKFVNTVPYVEFDAEGKRCYRSKRVESPTGAISISFSGTLGQSFTEEALKAKKVLQIYPGQTVDFTEEEGKFLVERYPFLEEANAIAAQPEVKSLGQGVGVSSATKAVDTAEAPTNFMAFKKWAKAQGVEVLPKDTKDVILQKLEIAKAK